MSGNRLAGETSPYLRLHASNPVDWEPWSEQAFARARREDKPIFLSIGYYTCHWCHVMERESFSDPALAEILNREFVSIKVDREERPDVDRVYMTYVQATTGGGGWPLSAFLTPELKPFYGGTYFPPQDRQSMPSFSRVLRSVAQAWRESREKLLSSADQVSRRLSEAVQAPATDAVEPDAASPAALRAAVWPSLWHTLSSNYDAAEGGFGGAPKFPRPVAYTFLLRYACGHPNDARAAIDMVTRTLTAMADGGMHDALGGGFHRYATDPGWRVPHFEKMLYDQAQLAVSYVDAWRLTRAPALAVTARSTLDFVLREMSAPGGGFYSAQDADSPLPENPHEVGEGAYYLWSQSEIEAVLGPALDTDAPAFIAHYGVEPDGNVPAYLDPQGEFTGKNILYGPPAPELESARQKLYAVRRTRPHPPTDKKVLTAWNGLTLSALASAGAALNEPRYLAAAQAAAHWLERERWEADTGRLVRTAAIAGFAEDYAYLIQGLLDLYQADFDPHWLDWARALQQAMDARFAAPAGGYYSGPADPDLWLRLREEYDGAEPSPNSVALANLLRLDAFFPSASVAGAAGEAAGYRGQALRLVASFAPALQHTPEALPLMAAWLDAAATPPQQLAVTGAAAAADTQALLQVARQHYLPGYDVHFQEAAGNPATAFLCHDYRCELPVTTPAELAAALAGPLAQR